MQAYIQTKAIREDGNFDSLQTIEVPCKVKELPWQTRGYSFTATGYGSRIPTRYMVEFNGKWRRVYCRIYSNSGTLYIGKKYNGSIVVNINTD